MRATFISPNKFIIKIYSMVYVMILIMYYKYYNSFIYNWSKLKKVVFSGSKNEFFFRTEEVYESSVENILTIKFVSV